MSTVKGLILLLFLLFLRMDLFILIFIIKSLKQILIEEMTLIYDSNAPWVANSLISLRPKRNSLCFSDLLNILN